MIAEEVAKYWDWVAGLAAVPVVREFRDEMAVVGETPNVAARLQGMAAPGTVVVGERTRRLVVVHAEPLPSALR